MVKLDIVIVCLLFFFFNDTATPEIYTLSLHDALPISIVLGSMILDLRMNEWMMIRCRNESKTIFIRSEEHTSELQSHSELV